MGTGKLRINPAVKGQGDLWGRSTGRPYQCGEGGGVGKGRERCGGGALVRFIKRGGALSSGKGCRQPLLLVER
jgi:hypothetical protein